MVQFCLEHGEELRIGFFRTDRPDRVLFCFRNRWNAAEFAGRFGGKVVLTPPDDDCFLRASILVPHPLNHGDDGVGIAHAVSKQ